VTNAVGGQARAARLARVAAFCCACVAAGALPAAAQSLGLAPAEFQHRFKPGQPFQFELAVSNASRQTVVMHAVVTDFWYDEKDQKTFDRPGSSPRSAGNWSEVVPPDLTVPAGGTAKAWVVVTPPAHASGGYYGVVFFESRPEMMDRASTGEPPVYAKIRLGSLILLSAENTEDYQIDVSDVHITPPAASRLLALDMTLSNQSNTHIFPLTKFVIMNANHGIAAKAEGEVLRFLPGERKRLTVAWAGVLPAGTYTAIVSISYGRDRLWTEEVVFTVTDS
jgi:hypothetical protein